MNGTLLHRRAPVLVDALQLVLVAQQRSVRHAQAGKILICRLLCEASSSSPETAGVPSSFSGCFTPATRKPSIKIDGAVGFRIGFAAPGVTSH